jgi:hypothetical protein
VWVLQDGQPKAVPVHTGLTDGAMTEVDSPDLQEGAVVILGEEVAPTRGTTATGNTTNPFAPQIFRGGRGR